MWFLVYLSPYELQIREEVEKEIRRILFIFLCWATGWEAAKVTQLMLSDYQPLFGDLSPRVVEQFITFHRKHPGVFILFKTYAEEARKRWPKFSSKAICERLRWETSLPLDGEFKLNNNFPACYSRLLIAEDSSFEGFFSTRHTPGTVYGEAA
jgi:hypothetical protein